MARFGFAVVLAGVSLAVLSSAPFLLMGIALQDDDVPEMFDVLLGVGWGLGGVLVVGGLFLAALGAFAYQPQGTVLAARSNRESSDVPRCTL
jgi:hypothetical protein